MVGSTRLPLHIIIQVELVTEDLILLSLFIYFTYKQSLPLQGQRTNANVGAGEVGDGS